MTDIIQALIDGIVQGITEFLPVSSTAHLYLARLWQDSTVDVLGRIVVVHLATLVGASWALRAQLAGWLKALWRPVSGASGQPYAGKLVHVLVASIPVLVAGAVAQSVIEGLYTTAIVGATTLFFGLLLAASLHWGRGNRDWDSISMTDALAAGCAQVLALIPGTSRSGICLTALTARGLHPAAAARFAVLMALPVLAATVVWLGWHWRVEPQLLRPVEDLCAGVSAAVCAWAVVRYGLPYLERSPKALLLWACVVWRLLLGSALIGAVGLGWAS